MPAGRHGHKMREFKRRIDAVLDKERERRKPPPPTISAEHAALREKIVEEWKAIEWDYSRSDETWYGDPLPMIETLDHATEVMKLMNEEKKLLAQHGVDSRPYDTYPLD